MLNFQSLLLDNSILLLFATHEACEGASHESVKELKAPELNVRQPLPDVDENT